MRRFFVLLSLYAFISCQDKVICPAYQSTYILDDTTRNAFFSYAWQLDEVTRNNYFSQQQSGDSLANDSSGTIAQHKTDYYAYAGEYVVPWNTPKKTKFGIVKSGFYPIKTYRMRTAPMENVLGPEPLSNRFEEEEFGVDSLESDSTGLIAGEGSLSDTTSVAQPQDSESHEEEVRFLYGYNPNDIFNVEQLYYNKYFSDRLIDDRPRPEPKEAVGDSLTQNTDSLSAKKPFFKNLFKKKKKSETEKSEPEAVTTDASDAELSPDSTSQPVPEGNGGQ